MDATMGTLRRVTGVGLVWGVLWAVVVMTIGMVIGIVDPNSIDLGEGPLATTAIFGPMGFYSGVVFALLLVIRRNDQTRSDVSLGRGIICGLLGTVIVQVAYLDHGDQGLAANIQLALVFCVFGGLIAMAWLKASRRALRYAAANSGSFVQRYSVRSPTLAMTAAF